MSSTGSTGGSLFTPLQFTGISQYSSDFQSILTRATSIAALPIQELANQNTTLQTETTDLSTLGIAVSAVGSSLQALGNLGTGSALTATSSDSGVVTATNTGAATATSYTITNVTSIASAASETSTTHYANASSTAVSSTGTMQLNYGSKTYPIALTPSTNNLTGLQSAINQLNVGVTASILTTQNGDYLTVTANSPGATTLKVIDDPSGAATNIVTGTNQGSNTVFDLNNIPISEAGTTINDVIPGVTLKFSGLTSSNETVKVGLSTDRSQIESALQTLVTNYNSLANVETAQISTTSGSLSGNNIIYQIRSAMSSIVQYQGSGSMGNLANLGVEMSTTGVMSLNTTAFGALSDSQLASGIQLLGSSTTGIGGLQQAFQGLTDPALGTIAQQESQWSATSQKLTAQITSKTAQVTAMEQTLNRQLQAADASVAELASQQNILTASITSLDYASYGYNTSSTTSKST